MNNKFIMKYELATNFDRSLIEEIGRIDKDKSITTVYGKLRTDIVGGGRSSMVLPELTMEELESYVKLCHENGIEFNYLLNPMCMANKEFEKKSHNELIEFIKTLVDIGVDGITLNSPYLCELVKKQFSSLKVTVGLHAYVQNIQHIKFWEKLGADELTLHYCANRNLKLLENMLTYAKGSGITLRLIANNGCLHDCPFRISHSTGQAHASQKGDRSEAFYMDYNIIKCTTEKIKNPVQLISSEWIRPEDVRYYEELCEKTGNYNFSIKLVDRTKTTDFLIRVAKAYLDKNYEGNLLDIMLWPSLKEVAKINKAPMEEIVKSGTYNMNDIEKFFNVLKLPELYIDNKKLDGFFKKFTSNYECNCKTCEALNESNNEDKSESCNATKCSYCKQWAKKSILFDYKEIDKWVNNSEELITSLTNESIYSR